eukprot:COSAG02_NODE_52560_length_307_cov_0.706731_1_plen_72_part_10
MTGGDEERLPVISPNPVPFHRFTYRDFGPEVTSNVGDSRTFGPDENCIYIVNQQYYTLVSRGVPGMQCALMT